MIIPLASVFGIFNDMITNFLNVPGSEIWVYVLLGTIIFVETGLVFFPFLPGDSILFFVGSMTAMHPKQLSMVTLVVSLTILAFLANLLNYEIGRKFGETIPKHPKLGRFLKDEYLEEARRFFDKYGASAIFLGRFMPIIRTIVPFTAGTAQMPHKKFVLFNFLGGLAWVVVATVAGYFFGGLAFVKAHFELIMMAIILVSLLPAVITGMKKYFDKKKLAA
ncbi:MAG: VTT domain-containing protein [Streptococcaceae bacterium]|jgi:membrane-associated protein|nr:VTT domain-containing protein [Streptococcaceae bacterium]